MTPAQLSTLQNDIMVTNNAALQAFVDTTDDQMIAAWYNTVASPNFWAFRTSIPVEEYTGAGGVVWTEVDSLTIGKARIFEWMTGFLTRPINAADSNKRQGIVDAFSGANGTLTNFSVIRRRLTTRFERLFAEGAGSTASPAIMKLEGELNYLDVVRALRPVGV